MSDPETGSTRPTAPPLPAWAHRCGVLQLAESTPPADAVAACERMLVIERVHRYCLGYDERRAELLGNCFTADGVWEGSVTGSVAIGPFRGREAIVKWLTEFWPHQRDQRRHMVLNTVVESQTATTARTLSYLLLLSSNGEQARFETMGFYRTDLLRESDAWRISHFFAGFDAPFWPGKLRDLSDAGKRRHGVDPAPS